jgi:hypothetical protein
MRRFFQPQAVLLSIVTNQNRGTICPYAVCQEYQVLAAEVARRGKPGEGMI